MEPLVSIFSLTYNHAPYIRQCLDGFLMQKTNFPFEVIINDDCSTDGTTEIIKEYAEKYPEIIKPIFHSENQYSKGVRGMYYKFCLPKSKGKYIAFCEGDDCWIDPYKLQKQIDFLEHHQDYGLVHTCAKVFNVTKNKYETYLYGSGNNTFLQEIIGNAIATLTVCLRKSLFIGYYDEIKPYSHEWKMGDYPLWLWCTTKMKIGFLEDVTSEYHLLPESASHSRDYNKLIDFELNVFSVSLYFAQLYLQNKDDWNHYINKRFTEYLQLMLYYRALNKSRILFNNFKPYSNYLSYLNKLFLSILHFIALFYKTSNT